MASLFWLLIIAALAGLAFWWLRWWHGWRRREAEREQAAAARLASMLAEARTAAERWKTGSTP